MTTLDERPGEGACDGDDPRGGAVLNAVAAQGRETVGAHGREAVWLDRPGAALPLLAGSKAANLARAAGAGLPVLPGFVITHPGPEADDPHDSLSGGWSALRQAWDTLSDGGERPLVVRSSSPQEDTQESSLAGRFASVLDVRGWADFRTAVRTVLDSAHRPGEPAAPMAVLVQPMLTARVGGVMFGADPVEGRADRMLVSAVRGGPDSLVSGEQAGIDYSLSLRGRMLRREPADAEPLLGRSNCAGWPASRGAPARSSTGRRTSSSGSTTTDDCGCSRAGRSPRWPPGRHAEHGCWAPARSPRACRISWSPWRKICG
ncbi:hypothetical protein GCM10023084_50860 [Streptomyces lacrimifluminis]|uniref:Pyruvate phosphate dikinase AMP/ATP-binding domain-containing protein n=1 Tax=Streptomyces lacrimifluminis TaxID=1500077 RepID=A0A917L9T2_9ACTN|nr:PEP/pyruvate-binding domain-containing protein [Streptomyces lacrimifluminis]GGJ52197.1 hypothetical protein GCM10012282_56490 [Streptomyces lacrimifluminis]